MSVFRTGISVACAATLCISLASSCGAEQSGISAREVCGGLSEKAATALTDLTSAKRFTDSSADYNEELLRDIPPYDESLTFCVITPEGKNDPIETGVVLKKLKKLPPAEMPGTVGLRIFDGIGLRAVSYDFSANIFFACKGKDIIRGRIAADPPGHKDEERDEHQVTIIQDLSRKAADSLGCPDHGGIPKV